MAQNQPGGPHPPPPKLSDEQKKEVLAFIQKNMPGHYKKLLELKEIDSPKYEQILVGKYGEMLELKKLEKENTEMYKILLKAIQLEDKSMTLAEQYRKASQSEKDKIIKDLKTVLNELFDLREKEREYRIKELEKEIAYLKELLEQRKSHKEEIIQEKLDDLTGKNEWLQW